MIESGDALGFFNGGDVFAQVVGANRSARAVDFLGGIQQLLKLGASNEAAREFAAGRRLLRHLAQGPALRKPYEESSEHTFSLQNGTKLDVSQETVG